MIGMSGIDHRKLTLIYEKIILNLYIANEIKFKNLKSQIEINRELINAIISL
jgi:hypothetical protein